MRYLTLLVLAGLSCGISSCIKKTNTAYRLSGTLYWDCNMQPASGQEVRLWNDFKRKKDLGMAVTDSGGRFEFVYDKVGRDDILSILMAQGFGLHTITEGLPVNQSYDLGDLFINERGRLHVNLSPAQQYSAQDTLLVSIQANEFDGPDDLIRIPGPFDSVVIVQASVVMEGLIGGKDYSNETGKGKIRWWLNEHPPMYEDWFYVRGCGVRGFDHD